MEAKLLMITTIMTATMRTIETLKVVCQDIDKKGVQAETSDLTSIECNLNPEVQALASLAQKCHSYKDSVEVMQNRVGKLIDLVSSNVVPNVHTLTGSDQLADGLKEKSQGLTASISNSLLDLTRRSVSDNATVRIVTIITLIYLPTQFVAVSNFEVNLSSSCAVTNFDVSSSIDLLRF
jgi:hypothetical protein